MSDDRWARLDSVLHAALVRPPEAREPFVREACGDDAALRDEVLSLLKHDGSAGDYLERPAIQNRPRLAPGQRLGPYRIEAFIDAGGMGEVYRATDTRLGRDVAVKVLPRELGDDPQHRHRFEREARAIGSLKHPNICPLFDVGEHDGQSFLVMELVEGETLAKCIERGPLPINQALRYAIEIAAALDRAHRQAIVHRDLKPANIIVTKAGVKLIDFGLAKFRPSLGRGESVLPTRTESAVGGTILGTLQYMSPEQIQGREADARSDIFAFGAVLYEMVTARKAFDGATQAGLISAILRDQPPPISMLRSLAPAALDRVVKTCLEKDPDERWQSAGDLGRELQWVAADHKQGASAQSGATTQAAAGRKRVVWATAWLGAGVFLAVIATWVLGPASRAPTHSQVDITPAEALRSSWTDQRGRPAKGVIALSPNGRTVVFAGDRADVRQLFRLTLDSADPATPIVGTEGADTAFFSPDGRWIGFWVGEGNEGRFLKVPLDGGPVQPLCLTTEYGAGATWGEDGVIVFGGKGLKRIPAAGGEPSALTTPRLSGGTLESGHHHPHALPRGLGWLYTVAHGAFSEDVSVWVLSGKTGESHLVIEDAADARYAAGHLLFARGGKLMAGPFDLGELRLTGGVVVILDSVLQALNGGFNANRAGTAQYAFSENGSLAYVTGGINRDRTNSLVWHDLETGKSDAMSAAKRPFVAPRLSPEKGRIAVTTRGADETAILVYDLKRGDWTKLPFEGRARFPLWTTDGQRVVFTGEGKNFPFELYSVPADGGAPATPLTRGGGGVAGSWDAEGNLIFVKPSATALWGDTDIMLLSMKDKAVRPLLATREVQEFDPTLSPDGQWLAYTSNESSRNDVFVRPYPDLKRRFPVSTGGGTAPRWVLNGKALLYRTAEQGTVRVMKVDVSYTPQFSLGHPKKLWEGPAGSLGDAFPVRSFDATADGRRLLAVQLEDPTPAPPILINVVQDWFDELRAKVRAGGKGSRP